ncbi:MAG: replication-associated recombination protein A, partial [Erysipelotrichaceae bacterium]|nr:replication-associated recombination protein A [Erysipelotrichaceae bacterium]
AKDKWHLIQYLPDELKDVQFYSPNTNSSYEKALAENYEKLKKYYRTNNMKKINRE